MDTDETCGCVFDERTGELNECKLHSAIRSERNTWMARYVKAREKTDGLRRELDVLERAHAVLGEAYTDMRVERNKLREETEALRREIDKLELQRDWINEVISEDV